MEMAASYLALPSSASEADREGAHASAHHGAYSSPQPPRATVRARRATRDATACRASRIPHSPEPPGDPPVHGSPRQRSSDHNHLRCTEDRRHCKARWTETKGARPPRERGASSEMRIESECGLRSSRVHESSSCAYGTPHSRRPERAAAGTLNAYSALPSQYGVTYSRSRTYMWYDS